MSKVLFILKRRLDYNAIIHSHIGMSTGLYNSASFMNEMLVESDIDSVLEVAADYNQIDRFVTQHKPKYAIIEALWVIPSKFAVLQKLHPDVKWIIRLHSDMPFLAGEGMSMNWIGDYFKFKNIVIAANSPRMLAEMKTYYQTICYDGNVDDKVIYLPNYYPQDYSTKKLDKNKDIIDVACFGAIRPLKNHLIQACAAIDFANRIDKKLRFHVNAGRIEMQGGPVINNLKHLFAQLSDSGHEMINHSWRPRDEFLELCCQMDIGLQVSFSETFNIVGADLISQGVPIVGSAEIPWKVPAFSADPTDSKDITDKLLLAYSYPRINVWTNKWSLTHYTNQSKKIWTKYFI